MRACGNWGRKGDFGNVNWTHLRGSGGGDAWERIRGVQELWKCFEGMQNRDTHKHLVYESLTALASLATFSRQD